tara:strand:- start:93 stop:563 length:471 start_codon:yes stop_codon:yes gene_type:complete
MEITDVYYGAVKIPVAASTAEKLETSLLWLISMGMLEGIIVGEDSFVMLDSMISYPELESLCKRSCKYDTHVRERVDNYLRHLETHENALVLVKNDASENGDVPYLFANKQNDLCWKGAIISWDNQIIPWVEANKQRWGSYLIPCYHSAITRGLTI